MPGVAGAMLLNLYHQHCREMEEGGGWFMSVQILGRESGPRSVSTPASGWLWVASWEWCQAAATLPPKLQEAKRAKRF